MKIILLSGGSGRRLWPVSNNIRSKQFLRLFNGQGENKSSMIERVWNQLRDFDLCESTIIATNHSQVEQVEHHIGSKSNIIIEPVSKNTFPAISLAASYLFNIMNCSLNETIIVLPVDMYVDHSFFAHIMKLEKIPNFNHTEVALVGKKPDRASERYGYILPGNKIISNELGTKTYDVKMFKEKPSMSESIELIKQGALINCGVFAFKLGFILKKNIELGYSTDYYDLLNNYENLPNVSMDVQVVEKSNSISVMEYTGDWKDIGTWDSLTEELSQDVIGNAIKDDSSKNTNIINELNIPIIVQGGVDLIVAASPDGILVSSKEDSSKLKESLDILNSPRPMYEERRWGWYKILDFNKTDYGEVLTKKMFIKEGKNLSYQKHFYRSEVWTVIKGEGEFVKEEVIYKVKPGNVLNIPIQSKHALKALTDMEIIEVQFGTVVEETDIERINLEWHKITSETRLSDSSYQNV